MTPARRGGGADRGGAVRRSAAALQLRRLLEAAPVHGRSLPDELEAFAAVHLVACRWILTIRVDAPSVAADASVAIALASTASGLVARLGARVGTGDRMDVTLVVRRAPGGSFAMRLEAMPHDLIAPTVALRRRGGPVVLDAIVADTVPDTAAVPDIGARPARAADPVGPAA